MTAINTIKESCLLKKTVLHVPSELARSLYYYVQWTGHFVCKSDFYIERSNFNSYLLIYTVSGSGILNYGGGSTKLYKNSLALIDCRLTHEYYPTQDGWEFRYIHFNGALSEQYYAHISALKDGLPVMPAEYEAQKYFTRLLELTESSVSEEICSELIYRLLIGFISSENAQGERDAVPNWLTDTLWRISEGYGTGITATSLADEAHLSRSFFSTEFKRYTGFTPYNYILIYKLTAAKKLLYSSSRSVEEIALRCGFSDSSSFIRAFKRAEGVSPAVYRAGERSKS